MSTVKKIKLSTNSGLTFEDACNMYLDDCRIRNLREGTINHYKQSYRQFYKYFDPSMPIEDFNKDVYDKFVIYMRETIKNDISINSYLKDLTTTLRMMMRKGYIEKFDMPIIKTDKHPVETYTDEELDKLLTKPDMRKCDFAEYQSWVMTSFLFSTGMRQRSMNNIKIKDVDFDNNVIYVNFTKNRKVLIVPMIESLKHILQEYLKHRQHKSNDEYLFTNIFGQQLTKSTGYHRLYWYNKNRGVETTGIHRYRHTFAKQWILRGGDVVSLSRILGHSSLDITQNYLNLLVSDIGQKAEEINILSYYGNKTKMKMR